VARRTNRKQRGNPAKERRETAAGPVAAAPREPVPGPPTTVAVPPANVAPATTRRPRTRRASSVVTLVAGAAVAVLAALAYVNSISPATVHDDSFFVPARHDLSSASLVQMFSEDTWASTGNPAGTYRPLAILSIAVNGAMFGRDARGYHATNVVLHAIASLLVFLLVLELLGAERRGSDLRLWSAALAAAVFAVHPIHTEAVDSVFNRSEILATMAVVGALWVLQRWHEHRPVFAWGMAAVLYLAGLLCRESAVTLPALAVLMLWFVHAGTPVATRLRIIAPVAVLLIPLAEYYVLRQHGLADQVQAQGPGLGVETGQDFVSRLSYSAAVLREYARMMVWPWPLRMSYENFTGEGLLLTSLVHAALAAGAFLSRHRAPLVTFAIGFFYVALLPSTRVFTDLGASLQLGGQAVIELRNSLLVGERVAYLPSVSLSIALGVLLLAVARRRGAVAAAVLCAPALAAGFYVTVERNRQWQSAVALFAAEVEAAPDNGDGWRLYVSALSHAGRHEDAAVACDSQLEQPGRSAQLFNNCGVAYDRIGRNDHAVRAYTRAIEEGLVTVGHANRGRAYARMGRMAEAESEYIAAAESENDPARRHYRNGLRLARFHSDRIAEARREFEAALALQPDFAAAREALRKLPR
jgi:tetratricopeptide (TPR) repeat protein